MFNFTEIMAPDGITSARQGSSLWKILSTVTKFFLAALHAVFVTAVTWSALWLGLFLVLVTAIYFYKRRTEGPPQRTPEDLIELNNIIRWQIVVKKMQPVLKAQSVGFPTQASLDSAIHRYLTNRHRQLQTGSLGGIYFERSDGRKEYLRIAREPL